MLLLDAHRVSHSASDMLRGPVLRSRPSLALRECTWARLQLQLQAQAAAAGVGVLLQVLTGLLLPLVVVQPPPLAPLPWVPAEHGQSSQ